MQGGYNAPEEVMSSGLAVLDLPGVTDEARPDPGVPHRLRGAAGRVCRLPDLGRQAVRLRQDLERGSPRRGTSRLTCPPWSFSPSRNGPLRRPAVKPLKSFAACL